MQVQIDKDCAIILCLAPRPVVHAEIANRDDCITFHRWLFQPAKNGVITHRKRKADQQPLSRASAGMIAHDTNDF